MFSFHCFALCWNMYAYGRSISRLVFFPSFRSFIHSFIRVAFEYRAFRELIKMNYEFVSQIHLILYRFSLACAIFKAFPIFAYLTSVPTDFLHGMRTNVLKKKIRKNGGKTLSSSPKNCFFSSVMNGFFHKLI